MSAWQAGTSAPCFLAADLAALDAPVLCVVFDTEEEFDWNAPFSRGNRRVEALTWLAAGQRVLRRFGIVPCYLLDYPVATAPRTPEIFGPWLAAGECLVGAQLHPWVTPPDEEVVCPFNTFPCNLPPDLERRKLEVLTDAVAAALGVRPAIYKAGRYGIDIRREGTIADLGYLVDTSVVPHRSFAGSGGGPDFHGFPEQPFWSSPARRLLYLPVTQSVVGPFGSLARGTHGRFLFGAAMSRLHVPGALARLHLVERIMLTPEGTSLAEMCRLADAMLRNGAKVFTLSLHSPSLMPGGTPYAATREDCEALLARMEGFLEHFFGRMGGRATTPLALHRLALGEASDGAIRAGTPARMVSGAVAQHASGGVMVR
ncbi:polysaccharide deacetylase family protein [Roseomonas rosulenta]|uniref:polysaccharide deacetylase family protein n=1 Tax=Roseomonas rosulenta TaxID=2748667 RepID=UPI0018DFC828|nr:polysaccharide deacetylase family protein [Roseomonas rosulenta]